MTLVFAMLTVQVLLGGFDNLWHHEFSEDLPHKPWARRELKLHSARELLYALIFTSIAWLRWEGAFTYLLAALLLGEIVVTMTDFVVEDQTRRLPKFERILHTILAVTYGATLALWAPELLRWTNEPTGFTLVYYGFWSWLFTLFGAGVLAWGVRDLIAAVRLGVPTWQRHPIKAGRSLLPRTILVTGGTGFIGRALVRRLVERGDNVIVLTRDPIKARDMLGPLVTVVGNLGSLDDNCRLDAIVNLAGEPLVNGLWTARRKRLFLNSRLGVTASIETLVRRLKRRPTVLINGSAIGFYGDRPDEILTEESGSQDIFMSSLCTAWEDAAKRIEALGLRVCRLRIGLVLGHDGGVLPSMALPMRFGLTTQFGAGRNWMSWIHLSDLVRLIEFALDTPTVSGAINATAPEPVTHRDFMRGLGRVFGWQLRLAMPTKLLVTVLGELSSLFLSSQRVVPAAALKHNFEFRFATIDAALADIFGHRKDAAPSPALPLAYVNENCPICTAEFRHYQRVAFANSVKFQFRNIGGRAYDMAAYGLREGDLKKRLYATLPDGTVLSGVDAFIPLWRSLPYYRVLARVVALPGFYHLADAIYEGMLAPWLAARNQRREMKNPARCVGGY